MILKYSYSRYLDSSFLIEYGLKYINMKISNIKISNFRNIVSAEVDFSNINILTGRNSSGKTNFLLALSNALSTRQDHSDIFNSNVVTVGKGKKETILNVTIDDLNKKVCYITNDVLQVCVQPKQYKFKKIIDKSGMTRRQNLLFTGDLYNPRGKQIQSKDYRQIMNSIESWEHVENLDVYEKIFEIIEQDGMSRIIKKAGESHEFEEVFLSQIDEFANSIKSWIDLDSKYDFSSSLIHKYVTKQATSEELEEANNRLTTKGASITNRQGFNKAKFIQLVADVQSNKEKHDQFNKEVTLYSQGIVTSVGIGRGKFNKGEIVVDSPNGPKSIVSISSGTAVLIYFILLKNWLYLPFENKSFQVPHVMIFDEIDSTIHPTLMDSMVEVLRSVSSRVQLFVTTHSPLFLDAFKKEEIYLLKDCLYGNNEENTFNRCNIYDYKTIIERLPKVSADELLQKTNSELFVSGQIDSIFHG